MTRLDTVGVFVGILAVTALVAFPVPGSAQTPDGLWFWNDRTPPEITQVRPEAGQPTADPHQRVEFRVVDPAFLGLRSRRLDADSLHLTVDGNDRTADAVFQPDWISRYIPWLEPRRGRVVFEPDEALPDGERRINVQMADRASNVGSLEATLVVDTQPPVVTAVDPPSGEPVSDPETDLVLAVADAGVGTDWSSLDVVADDEPVDAQIDRDAGEVVLTATEWPDGELTVEITVADDLGNTGTSRISYEMQSGLSVDIRAVPGSGAAPLGVVFTPVVTTDAAIETYFWDLTDDGEFDRSEPIGREQRYTFEEAGTHTVTLRVVDSDGKEAEATTDVEVVRDPPEADVRAQPSNGAPPLEVTFTATPRNGHTISEYAWDFDGDGTYEETTAAGEAVHTYTRTGTFAPRIQLTDDHGAEAVIDVPTVAVRVAEGAPTVTGTVSPASGDAPLEVNFSASATDPEGRAIAEWAWDFYGDGDTEYVSSEDASVTHEYTVPGTHYPRVHVTTEDGRTSTDAVQVQVGSSYDLSVSTDTVDTELGETVTVETELGADTPVSLVIETPGQRVVRTLVPWQTRQAGTYSDTWDGRADDGELVSRGEYRAVLLYEIDGEEQRLDLGPGTGGREYNPSRNSLPNQFAPFADEPLEVTFTLPEASEVTSFIGRYNVNARLVTFHQREALGRGSHTILWHGGNADGALIEPPPGDQFLFGIFAFTLPDNAIYVDNGVHVTDLSVSPPIVDPSGGESESQPAPSRLEFTLNQPGAVELIVHDADTGTEVARRRVKGLDEGENVIHWDGRNAEGEYVAPGPYRLGVTGIDGRGGRTTTLYTLQRVYY